MEDLQVKNMVRNHKIARNIVDVFNNSIKDKNEMNLDDNHFLLSFLYFLYVQNHLTLNCHNFLY